MRHKALLCALAASPIAAVAFSYDDQPAVLADFAFGSAASASQSFPEGHVDLPSGQQQDSEPELEGAIDNNFLNRDIKDLRISVLDSDGNLVTNPDGSSPASGLSTSGSSSGSGMSSASLAGNSGGVATFNLSSPIPSGGLGNYELQIGGFDDAGGFSVSMTASTDRAGKHIDILGENGFTSQQNTEYFSGAWPTLRTGGVLGIVNADTTQTLSALRVTMITNDSARISSVEVTDASGNPAGSISVDTDGLGVTINSLAVSNPGMVSVWLHFTEAYESPTTFHVRAVY